MSMKKKFDKDYDIWGSQAGLMQCGRGMAGFTGDLEAQKLIKEELEKRNNKKSERLAQQFLTHYYDSKTSFLNSRILCSEITDFIEIYNNLKNNGLILVNEDLFFKRFFELKGKKITWHGSITGLIILFRFLHRKNLFNFNAEKGSRIKKENSWSSIIEIFCRKDNTDYLSSAFTSGSKPDGAIVEQKIKELMHTENYSILL